MLRALSCAFNVLLSGASEPAADEAQHAIESDEGDELRRAEGEAKSGRKR
jgi:hypothetical protein